MLISNCATDNRENLRKALMRMDVLPIRGAALGAVVHGADITGDMDKAQFEEIWAALDEHLVLVFRGHDTPSYAEFLSFGRRFGHIPKTGLTTKPTPSTTKY